MASDAFKGSAWLITHRGTLFAWHVQDRRAPQGLTRTRVVAFRQQQQAVGFCGMLGHFRNTTGSWPERVLDREERFPLLTKWVPTKGEVHDGLGLEMLSLDGKSVENIFLHQMALVVVENVAVDILTTTLFPEVHVPLHVCRRVLENLYNLS